MQDWVEKQLKNIDTDHEDYESLLKQKELAAAYEVFQTKMAEENCLDFNDLISSTISLFRKRKSVLGEYQTRYKYIMVDEFQDTNYVQSILMYMLSEQHQNLMAVGDDDQAIYRFRGASISNILQFEERFKSCKKIVLTDNYRSRSEILALAYNSIQNNNPDRLEIKAEVSKELQACSDVENKKLETVISCVHAGSGDDEAEYIAENILKMIEDKKHELKDIAILLRSNAGIEPLAQSLTKLGIPFTVSTRRSLFDQPIIKDLLAALSVIANPYDDISWFRVLKMDVWNLPMEELLQYLETLHEKVEHTWPHLKSFISEMEKGKEDQTIISVFKNLMDYSRDHDTGEVLHTFVQDINLFQTLQQENTAESYDKIQYVSQLFDLVKQFSEGKKEANIKDCLKHISIIQESRDIPSTEANNADANAVSILTVHSSKGLEFPVVFLPHLINGRFPTYKRAAPFAMPEDLMKEILPETDGHLQEERRLFYVACTRAKEQLILCWSDTYSATSIRKRKRSTFIEEISEKMASLITFVELEKKEKDVSEEVNLTVGGGEEYNKSPALQKINYSQLNTFLNCPRQFEYSYILKIPKKPSAALSFGSTLHNTLHKFYTLINQQQVAEKQPVLFEVESEAKGSEVSLESLLLIYEESWIPYGYESRGHMQIRKKKGEEILTEYYNKFQEYFGRPLYLEKSFHLPVGKYKVSGRIDRVDSMDEKDSTVEIFDYKTGRIKTQKDVDADLQLSIYAMAAREVFRKKVGKLSLYFLNDNLKVETERSDEQLEKAKDKIIEVVDEINESHFEAKPNKIKCKYCDFKNICDFAQL